MNGPLYLLGPQRPIPNMPTALATVERAGRVLYITAGWRHDENDDEALRRDVGLEGQSLPLYAWFEELARSAPELFKAHHDTQGEIRRLKQLYRARLEPALAAVRVMLDQLHQDPDAPYVQEEFQDAVHAVRNLRTRFIRQCDRVRDEFNAQHNPAEHPKVAERMREIEDLLSDARAVLIAGGHVGVLRNRLEFFGMAKALSNARKHGMGVIAWSAGAMSLTDEVVLFHDDPPSGQANPEVLDRGMGLANGVVYLPHARQRLHLHNKTKVSSLAWRYEVPCIGVENGAWLERQHGVWVNRGQADAAFKLGHDGDVHLLDVQHA